MTPSQLETKYIRAVRDWIHHEKMAIKLRQDISDFKAAARIMGIKIKSPEQINMEMRNEHKG